MIGRPQDALDAVAARHEHRARGMVDDLGRDRSDQESTDGAEPASTDHDEIGTPALGVADDLRRGSPIQDFDMDGLVSDSKTVGDVEHAATDVIDDPITVVRGINADDVRPRAALRGEGGRDDAHDPDL